MNLCRRVIPKVQSSIRALSSSAFPASPIISVDEVKALPRLKFIDASWYLNNPSRVPLREFEESHVDGAVYFDVDEIADKTLDLPHMLPSAEMFDDACSNFGISNDDTIVVYAMPGSPAAPRVWWTFKVFGHENVYVMDGGFKEWAKSGGAVAAGPWEAERTSYQSKGLNSNLVKRWDQVLDISNSLGSGAASSPKILDARPAPRFRAEAPEPRPNVAGGRIPHSLNLPSTQVCEEGDPNTFLPKDQVTERLLEAGIDGTTPVVTTCGSGMTAAVLAIAITRSFPELGIPALYDGSWSEWGARDDLPIEK